MIVALSASKANGHCRIQIGSAQTLRQTIIIALILAFYIPLHILLAPDKFKGSLSAEQVCAALREGLLKRYPHASIVSVPLADGGEGTSELLTLYFHGTKVAASVSNPLFEKITATYGYAAREQVAFIEMAQASGLELLPREKQNPLYTTTYGTGELINDALERGAKKILLGIGGSATNDAGIGMAEALGFQFFDQHHQKIKPTGENLIHLHTIDASHIHPRIQETEFIALCDIANPLYGSHGAAAVYAPQKGADKNAVALLEEGLKNYERVVQKELGRAAGFPGAGAGGGMASGAHVFLNARIEKGMSYVMHALELEEKIKQADLVITGEGKIDRQTLSGKVVSAVASLASAHHKKVIVVCGQCELRQEELYKMGIHELLSLTDPFTSQEEAVKNAYELIKQRINEMELS